MKVREERLTIILTKTHHYNTHLKKETWKEWKVEKMLGKILIFQFHKKFYLFLFLLLKLEIDNWTSFYELRDNSLFPFNVSYHIAVFFSYFGTL